MSAFHATVSQLNSLRVASYLYCITKIEVGRGDDIKKIVAGVKKTCDSRNQKTLSGAVP